MSMIPAPVAQLVERPIRGTGGYLKTRIIELDVTESLKLQEKDFTTVESSFAIETPLEIQSLCRRRTQTTLVN